MKLHTPSHPVRRGSALIAALTTIMVVSILAGIVTSVSTNTARIADRSQELAVLKAAADGAVEHAYAIWRVRLAQQNRAITTAEATASITPPSFTGLSYNSALAITATDPYGTPGATATSTMISVPGYPGWRGRSFKYMVTARLASAGVVGSPVEYGVKRFFTYTEVPLFQSMFYFEHDLEMYRPATMIVGGLVHTNRWGFVSNDVKNANYPLTFTGNVSHVLGWTNTTLPYQAGTWGGYRGNSNQLPTFPNGYSTQVTQVSRLEPLGQDPAGVLDTPPAGPLAPALDAIDVSGLPILGADGLAIKIKGQLIGPDGNSDSNQDNDSMHELIEPPVNNATDPPEIAKRRLYNKAGIIVTVNGTTKSVATQNGTSLTPAQITAIQSATTSTTIYDQREQTTVRVSSVDVGAIRPSLNAATGFNGVLFVRDTTATTTAIPKNAVRLVNGGMLPDAGLTVASSNGVYIQGDYNSGATSAANAATVPSNNGGNPTNTDAPTMTGYTRKPSAVIGDAIMLLSNAWSDANSSLPLTNRVASNTTVNTAMLAGFMPSGYTPASGSQYGYSGGANNYPRFLENWNGKYHTYFGSMVELFSSTSFTGKWDTGSIYSPPNRCWNYDTNFDNASPPGSIDAVAMSRGTWARY